MRMVYDADHRCLTEVRAQCGPVLLTGHDLLITQRLTDPHVDVNIKGVARLGWWRWCGVWTNSASGISDRAGANQQGMSR